MLYASTKATFKKQFGAGQIKEDYYANHREEVRCSTLQNLVAHSFSSRSLCLVTRSFSLWRWDFFVPFWTKQNVISETHSHHLVSEQFSPCNFQAAPGPLSQAEEEQKAIKEAEARTEVTLKSLSLYKKLFFQVSVDTKHNTLSGLAFPLQPEATDAIREYSQGSKDYVQLAIGEGTDFTIFILPEPSLLEISFSRSG